MRKSSFCSCRAGIGCGALGSALENKKWLKKLSTAGGKSGFSMCWKPSGFLVWGAGLAMGAVCGTLLVHPCCSGGWGELPWGTLEGWDGGQGQAVQDCSLGSQDSSFSCLESPGSAFLRQGRAQCISCTSPAGTDWALRGSRGGKSPWICAPGAVGYLCFLCTQWSSLRL